MPNLIIIQVTHSSSIIVKNTNSPNTLFMAKTRPVLTLHLLQNYFNFLLANQNLKKLEFLINKKSENFPKYKNRQTKLSAGNISAYKSKCLTVSFNPKPCAITTSSVRPSLSTRVPWGTVEREKMLKCTWPPR